MDASGVAAAVVVSACLDVNLDNNEYGQRAVAAAPSRLRQIVDVDSRWAPTYHVPGAADRLRELCDRLAPIGASHYLARDNDGWLLSLEAAGLFAELARRGLFVSLAAPPGWFDDIVAIAATVPELPIMLNHLALTMLDPSPLECAQRMVHVGASVPNVMIKASGYYYGDNGSGKYPYRDRLSILQTFYETWGPSRVVWASDYPAASPHMTYRQSLDVLRDHASFIARADFPEVLGGTMAKVLGISSRGAL
jgi:predicted TIM-barrel fold metal-dependent hydrolase